VQRPRPAARRHAARGGDAGRGEPRLRRAARARRDRRAAGDVPRAARRRSRGAAVHRARRGAARGAAARTGTPAHRGAGAGRVGGGLTRGGGTDVPLGVTRGRRHANAPYDERVTSSPFPARLRTLTGWEPSPVAMRRSALAAVVANSGIAFTGAVVRVTGSGLGCPEWPRCTGDSLVPVRSPDHPVLNMFIEFGNRMLGVGVFVTVAICLLVALRMRPRRRDLTVLAALLPAGVLLQ